MIPPAGCHLCQLLLAILLVADGCIIHLLWAMHGKKPKTASLPTFPAEPCGRGEGKDAEYRCPTRDISSEGVFFYCTTELTEQSPVELVLTLPPRMRCGELQALSAQATVVRVERDLSDVGRHGIAVSIELCRVEYYVEAGHAEDCQCDVCFDLALTLFERRYKLCRSSYRDV